MTAAGDLDLGELECAAFAAQAESRTQLGGWAEGIEVFRIYDVLYIPDYGIPVCGKFVPLEAIGYADHLDIRLGRFPGGPPGPDERFLDREIFEISEHEVCILGNIYSGNFTHWSEELLKVVVLEEFGFDGPYVVPEWYPRFAFDSLAMLGITKHRILSPAAPVIYKAALLTTVLSHYTVHRFPDVVLYLRDRLQRAVDIDMDFGERIWAERGGNARNGRELVNKEETYRLIREYGFVPIDFGSYGFAEQLAIDRNIEVLSGPHGSAFAHCGFMQTEREVLEVFSPFHVTPNVVRLCLAMRHRYSQVVSPNAWHTPYRFDADIMVDLEHLELALKSLRPQGR